MKIASVVLYIGIFITAATAETRQDKLFRTQCSQDWQIEYRELHSRILHDKSSKQRYAIFDTIYSGMADRLTSAITVFFYALLTDRAYKIRWQPGNLSRAYDAPNIDWTYNEHGREADATTECVENWYGGPRPLEELEQIFRYSDLNATGRNCSSVRWTMNHGQLNQLFSNPYHRERLLLWGFHPETAFGCAFNFLFSATDEVLNMLPAAYNALQDETALIIGIQIRVGDHSFGQGRDCKSDIDNFWPTGHSIDEYYNCASQIEEHKRLTAKQRVIWFVISDCFGVRVDAKEKYGDKVMTNLQMLPTHLLDPGSDDGAAFLLPFAENWLFGMTQFQVFTQNSQFGRLAALRSLQWRSMYTIHEKNRICGVEHYHTLRDVAKDWVLV